MRIATRTRFWSTIAITALWWGAVGCSGEGGMDAGGRTDAEIVDSGALVDSGAASDGGGEDAGRRSCSPVCADFESCCDTFCVATDFDPLHCGECGLVCPSGMCAAGNCVP